MVSCILLAVAVLVVPGGSPRLPGTAMPDPAGIGLSAPGLSGGPPARGLLGLVGRIDGSRPAAGRDPGGSRRRIGPTGGVAVVLAAILLVPVLLLAGPVVVLAAVILLATGSLLVRRAVVEHRRRRALVDVLAALRMFGRELRAGADPGAAVDRARATARGAGADVFGAMAQLIRAGDRDRTTPGGLSVGPLGADPASAALARLSGGWRLTTRHGVALAPMVDSLAQDLAEQLSVQTQRAGQVAGPRTSGYVLAALPLLGLALGTGMGAAPVTVLLNTAVGHLLLLVGVMLNCLGLLWAAKIVAP